MPFRLSFDSPGFLALLAVLPLLWWWSFRGLAALGNVRRMVAIFLRTAVIVLLVLAAAETQLKRVSERLTVIYCIDESLSIPESLRPAMVQYVNREIVTHRDTQRQDNAGALVFGGDPAIEHPPDDDNIVVSYNNQMQFDREHTNLAAALRMAQAMFPENSARRIVVLSDGNENIGDALEQARTVVDSGVSIDVVPIRYSPRSEVVVEKVTIPPDIHKGQPFDLRVVLNNITPDEAAGKTAKPGAAQPAKGRLKIIRKTRDHEQLLSEQEVTVEPGKRVFTLREQIDAPDFYTYDAQFIPDDAAHDSIKENKRATAFTHVRGQGQILLIEDEDERGKFDFLVERLRHENLQVTVQASRDTFTTLAELQPYDSVILADVPAEQFTEDQMKMLVRNTQQMGSGLVMLGGPNSFGAGGWTNTPVEEAMPVDFQIKNTKIVPVGALAMLMHASEMANGNFWQKKIAQEALRSLGGQDYCGVVHWDGNTRWLWTPKMSKVASNRNMMLGRIDRMTPGDMPDFDGPMAAAAQAFTQLPDAAVKHMIVISDGDPGAPTGATIQAFKDQKVTISTVAVAAHDRANSQTLRDMATVTGGKYYEVQANQQAQLLPRIYQKEARAISRPLVFEQQTGFKPEVKFPHEMIQGLGNDFPPLTGYVLTTVKESPLVEVALVNSLPTGEEKYNTLLAGWTFGLGKSVVFTSDAGARWATPWTQWAGYDKLFSQIVRWSMRPAGDQGKFSLSTEVQDGKVKLVVTALDKDDEFLNFLDMSASAVGPDMKPIDVKVRQVAPGRYVGEFPAQDAGSYLLMLAPGAGMAPILSGVNVPYSAEFLDREPNEELLKTMAMLTPKGGQPGAVIQDTRGAGIQQWLADFNTFRHDMPPASSTLPVWHWLVLTAACVFVADVFIRRVQVNFNWAVNGARYLARIVMRKPKDTAPTAALARLKSRKAEVAQSLEQRRAAARFEPTAPADAAAPPPVAELVAEPGSKPKPAKPASLSTQPTEDEDYTSRLLKAKKKVWDEKQGGKS